MERSDQLGYYMMALLFDHGAPFSVVFPEARLFLPDTRSVDAHTAVAWVAAAASRGWLTLSLDHVDGGSRPVTSDDLELIAGEYEQGARDANEVRQILERPDLWLVISNEGRAAVEAIWPEMPSEA